MRARGSLFVDKTGAIADLLGGFMETQSCVFFSRPRNFGKSTTLRIAGEMLGVGKMPRGVLRWHGYKSVSTKTLFKGLQVDERHQRRDTNLGSLLKHPHFVVPLSLGDAPTGATLEAAIIHGVASVAGHAFGRELKEEVLSAESPAIALGILVDAVPSAVPVALLVDDCDAAIVQDVGRGRWEAARAGLESLSNLLVFKKNISTGQRVTRFLVTGVAHFARTSLFTGANNFVDLTNHPLMSRVLGLSEAEIRATFPAELQRLAHGLGTDEDGAIRELARMYSGYCFDGTSTSFSPFPVLYSLSQGRIAGREEMEGASGPTNWLGLTPGDLVHGLVEELKDGGVAVGADGQAFDVADLQGERVRAVPLLLQTGLLSFVPGKPLLCRPPNEFAQASLRRMLVGAMRDGKGAAGITLALSELNTALTLRSHAAFAQAAKAILLLLPSAMLKDSKTPQGEVRELGYHSALAGALMAGAPQGVVVDLESAASGGGRGDIVVRFGDEEAWVLEVGVGVDDGSKVRQAQVYGEAQVERKVLRGSVVVIKQGSASAPAVGNTTAPIAITCAWSQRERLAGGGGHAWHTL